jgi:signal transduction histidine kinase/CheY-like chemotaxis protein
MKDPTASILEKICSRVFKDAKLTYFILDDTGRLLQWGGDLRVLNMSAPGKDSHIADALLFMEGILPLTESDMEFSCIKMSGDLCVDALVFEIEKGYGLIVWDATTKEAYLTETQQKCNELSLLIEQQKSRMVFPLGNNIRKPKDAFLQDLFLALDLIVLEMNPQKGFTLLGSPPLWIDQIPQSKQLLLGQACEEDVFSFLGNFIQEAKSHWAKNLSHAFRSGAWIEKDHRGQDLLLEATAIDIHGKKLIIIAQDAGHPTERQSIIQKGRDLALHYHELQRSDRKLKGLHDELETRVKERTRDLEQANLRLANELKERKKVEQEREEFSRQLRQSQKMEAIGTLAGGIAHDFNNILSAIMGFTELSLYEAGEGSKIKSRLEKILNASNRAKELVMQILTFSHQTEDEKRPLKLRLIVSEVLNLMRASLPASIDIKKALQSNAYILADHTQIHQVIMNLCTNAWHAMKENGGTLSVTLGDIDIKPEDQDANPEVFPGQYVLLTITDTGCGIQPDIIEKIFDPYFTTKEKDKGTGLGLSVVHGIIRKLNGHISINSQLGKGSEFELYFPLFGASNNPLPEKKPIVKGNNERILFVDDEPFQTELAEQLLAPLGYRVVTSNNSTNAYNIFVQEQGDFDLVITDMLMPKMTGKALAEKIFKIKPDIPIILCSGYSDDIDISSLKAMGINQYLLKPIGIDALARSINHALKKQ